jgi:hypothetical protein
VSGEDYYYLDGLTTNDTGYPPADTCAVHVKNNTAQKSGAYVMQRSLKYTLCSNSLVSRLDSEMWRVPDYGHVH